MAQRYCSRSLICRVVRNGGVPVRIRVSTLCGYKPNGKVPAPKAGSSPYGCPGSSPGIRALCSCGRAADGTGPENQRSQKGPGVRISPAALCIRAGGQHPVSKTGNDGPTPSGCAENSVCAWGISVSELCETMEKMAERLHASAPDKSEGWDEIENIGDDPLIEEKEQNSLDDDYEL